MLTYPRQYLEGVGRQRRRQCFVVTPYGKDFSAGVEDAIRRACHNVKPSLECVVARDSGKSQRIMTGILDGLYDSEVVIADLTGSNPNVLYELGIAHCYKTIERVIMLSQRPEEVPIDLQGHNFIPYRFPEGLGALVGHLETMIGGARVGARSSQGDHRDRWSRIKRVVEASAPGAFEGALEKIFEIAGEIARKDRPPVVRLWGSRENIDEKWHADFERIGRVIGTECARRGFALSGTSVHPDTLEFHALEAIADSDRPSAPLDLYLHRSGPDRHDSRAGDLLARLNGRVKLCDVTYANVNVERLMSVDPAVRTGTSWAHDARLGSLLQCDIVVLLAGTASARHLIHLMTFLEERRLRAAAPILFIPLPWTGGTAELAFRAFTGAIEDLHHADLVALSA